tara:strand:+ start:788 stop:1432 length:645 start_codon:yes stop_codon:yes gene_type:complete
MAVPDSGKITLSGIIGEIDDGEYIEGYLFPGVQSLKEFSTGGIDADAINKDNRTQNRPDETAPHKMSEFYSYDHDIASPFTSTISNFTISSTAGTGLGGTVYQLKTFTVNPHNGAVTGSIEVPSPNYGILSLAMSDSGDPGTSGTDNSGTGYKQQGTPCLLDFSSIGSAVTVSCRFRFQPHSGAANQNVDVTFNLSGDLIDAEDVVVVTKSSTR